jgi:hypothetical protein
MKQTEKKQNGEHDAPRFVIHAAVVCDEIAKIKADYLENSKKVCTFVRKNKSNNKILC